MSSETPRILSIDDYFEVDGEVMNMPKCGNFLHSKMLFFFFFPRSLLLVRVRRSHDEKLQRKLDKELQKADRERTLLLPHRGQHQRQERTLRRDVELRKAQRIRGTGNKPKNNFLSFHFGNIHNFLTGMSAIFHLEYIFCNFKIILGHDFFKVTCYTHDSCSTATATVQLYLNRKK